MKAFVARRLVTLLCATGMLGASSHAMAAAFQLWEQDAASVGVYHAGYAAWANDASTAWYNPAGIVRIKNQQAVLGAVNILTDFSYRGTIAVNTLGDVPKRVVAQGGTFNFVPNLHYVAPINDCIGFGFSVDAPFGLKTNYGSSTFVRYVATLTSLRVIDISPSLGFKLTDHASFGIGFDIQRMNGEFDLVGTAVTPDFDTPCKNKASDTGYGYHAGLLYEFNPCSRVGISYHSHVAHHLSGTSIFGPSELTFLLNEGQAIRLRSHATTNVDLPAYTALSVYHKFNPCFAFMASAIYTQWSYFQKLVLKNISGAEEAELTKRIQVVIPQNYRSAWNFSVGGEYYPTECITLRSGLGYDETPIRNPQRNMQLPDNNRYIVALGGHFQATKCVGLDLGWNHVFIKRARLTPQLQSTGQQVTTTRGHVTGGADIFSAQVVWDM